MLIWIVVAAVLCAVMAIRAERLLSSAIWLAGASALLSLILYLLGAWQVAVIELSVGAGLVTVLFVFAISIAGEDAMTAPSVMPAPVAWGLTILTIVLLGGLLVPWVPAKVQTQLLPFSTVFWQVRGVDAVVQIALIFAGVLGILALLSEVKLPLSTKAQLPGDFEARVREEMQAREEVLV